VGVPILSFRSQALWFLGYPDAARADAERALHTAREIGQAGTLMYAMSIAPLTHFLSGDYGVANTLAEEVIGLADEKGVLFWKALGTMNRGRILALTGQPCMRAKLKAIKVELRKRMHGPVAETRSLGEADAARASELLRRLG
jgi:hypothetical protein